SLRRWERVATPSAAPPKKTTDPLSVRRLLLLVAVVLQRGRRKPATYHAWQAEGHVAERRLDHANTGEGQLSGLAPPDHLALGQRSLAPDLVDVGEGVLANAFGLRGLCRVDDFVEDLGSFLRLTLGLGLEDRQQDTVAHGIARERQLGRVADCQFVD